MKPKVIAYATFAGDHEYHLVDSASGYNRTLCDLSTKGSLKKIRQHRPPARVTRETPPPTHAPCQICQTVRSKAHEPARMIS